MGVTFSLSKAFTLKMPPKQKPKVEKPSLPNHQEVRLKRRNGPREKPETNFKTLSFFDKATQDKFMKEVPAYKLITPAVVSERLKVRGSLARKALKDLCQKGLITQVVSHSSQLIFTRAVAEDEE